MENEEFTETEEIIEIEQPEKKFNFNAYCAQHPEYKARHAQLKKTKIECECGSIISRTNYAKHKLTNKHHKKMKQILPTSAIDKYIVKRFLQILYANCDKDEN